MSIQQLFQNKILINSVWHFHRTDNKTIIYALSNKTLDFKRMIGDGGMPSAHSQPLQHLLLLQPLNAALTHLSLQSLQSLQLS